MTRFASLLALAAVVAGCDASAPSSKASFDTWSTAPSLNESTTVQLSQSGASHLIYAFADPNWDGTFTSESLDSDGNVVIRFVQSRETLTSSQSSNLGGAAEAYTLTGEAPHPDVTIDAVSYLSVSPSGETIQRTISASAASFAGGTTTIMTGGSGGTSEHHHPHGEDRVDTEEECVEGQEERCVLGGHMYLDAIGDPITGINNVALTYVEKELPKVVAIRFTYPYGAGFKHRFGQAWESQY